MSAFLPAFTIHPLAEKFPALSQKDFDELKESIRKYGLFEPIITNEKNQILDGRHRYRAITELGQSPYCQVASFEETVRATKELTEEQFIYDSNMKRRHLTESQRAAVAAEFANMRQGERMDLEPSDNCPKVSQERAGQLFNVSSKSVRRAKNVKAKDPETFAKVKAGELSLNAAVKSVAAQEKVSSWSATDNQITNLDDTVEPTNTDESNSELEQMRTGKQPKAKEVFNAGIKPQSTRNVREETTFEEYVLGLLEWVVDNANLYYPDKTKTDVMSVLSKAKNTTLINGEAITILECSTPGIFVANLYLTKVERKIFDLALNDQAPDPESETAWAKLRLILRKRTNKKAAA
jgi:hypothetical protein